MNDETPEKTIPEMLKEYNALVVEANGLNRGLDLRERKCFKDKSDAHRSLASVQSSIRAARAAGRTAPEEPEPEPVVAELTEVIGQTAPTGDLPNTGEEAVMASQTKAKKTKRTKIAAAPKAKKVAAKSNGDAHAGPRKGSKMEVLHRMLTRKSGCTRAQVLAETGWKAVSMQQIAEGLGLKLNLQKEKGSVTTYFGE